MEIFYEARPNLLKSSAIALGFFDGVHLGHKTVIHTAVREAALKGLTPAVVTFRDHPRALTLGNPPLLISLIEQRLAIFESLGIEAALVLTFTEELCRLTPSEYVERVLVQSMNGKLISVGYNHHFGRQREGTPGLLRQYGQSMNFQVQVAEPVFLDNIEVSSSKIRDSLQKGELDLANQLLERRFSLLGTVVAGDKRGRELGFPTANLEISPLQILPASGVYAVKVKLPDQSFHTAVANIGCRPTINAKAAIESPVTEVHLLNFAGDLYGSTLEVFFYKYLRAERKFIDLEALKAQIDNDCQTAVEYFSS